MFGLITGLDESKVLTSKRLVGEHKLGRLTHIAAVDEKKKPYVTCCLPFA